LRTSIGTSVTGFTKAVISCSGVRTLFYAHPCFHGHEWYEWALVHFEENDNLGHLVETYYPLRILGFVSIDGKREAAIQCSSKPIHWNTVETKFIVQIKLGMDFNISFVTVPIDALVHPLCVFPDNREQGCDTFYVVLPKRNWSRYFGGTIQITKKVDYNINFITVPIVDLVHHFCVIPDNSKQVCDTFHIVLPKKKLELLL
jgi:hypothetical protein